MSCTLALLCECPSALSVHLANRGMSAVKKGVCLGDIADVLFDAWPPDCQLCSEYSSVRAKKMPGLQSTSMSPCVASQRHANQAPLAVLESRVHVEEPALTMDRAIEPARESNRWPPHRKSHPPESHTRAFGTPPSTGRRAISCEARGWFRKERGDETRLWSTAVSVGGGGCAMEVAARAVRSCNTLKHRDPGALHALQFKVSQLLSGGAKPS